MNQNKAYYFLIAFYALCLVIAGLGHVRDIWNKGWMPYTEAPAILNFYWTSLAAFDILAAILLFLHLKKGLVLVFIIMVSDVLVNSYATYAMRILDGGWSLQLQSLFLGLVLGGIPYLWTKASTASALNSLLDTDAQVRRSA